MKYLFYFIVVCALFIVTPGVYAHQGGLPLVKINGSWAVGNPIGGPAASSQFSIAADLAPQVYPVHQLLTFEVNEVYGTSVDGKSSMQFRWDFGDDREWVDGRSTKHVYDAPGSYMVTLLYTYPGAASYYPADNILVSVIPHDRYILPRAQIKVDGTNVPNRFERSVPFEFGRPVTFDATHSSGSNLTFMWDFGDKSEIASGAQVTHTYTSAEKAVQVVVLRATDANGIATDAAVFLTEREARKKTAAPQQSLFDRIIAWFKSLLP